MNARKVIAILLISVLSLLLFVGCNNVRAGSKLSDEKIAFCREQYPINSIGSDNTTSIQLNISVLIKGTSAYVVAEIINREPDTSTSIAYLDKNLEEQMMEEGLTPATLDCANYKIKIIDIIVTSNYVDGNPIAAGSQVKKGHEIVISFTKAVDVPKLDAGMVVTMLVVSPTQEDVTNNIPVGVHSSTQGLYYVVDGYVISGFCELNDEKFSGLPLEEFKSEIKSMKISG